MIVVCVHFANVLLIIEQVVAVVVVDGFEEVISSISKHFGWSPSKMITFVKNVTINNTNR
jgi:hypothetical protein